ncbi:non-ribosomal peptide synthetase/type I polyketide synthase [Nocardia elegans]|uniref:non-ribosomal peptide synthetase/type I polyketide synthase n=1 Tax=Nocardia elegans TaxID=300029 RepID=UPI001C3FC306|nr:non-ribosomal peptide synthetase/type I polyketide synthase [Nocardia elegans]
MLAAFAGPIASEWLPDGRAPQTRFSVLFTVMSEALGTRPNKKENCPKKGSIPDVTPAAGARSCHRRYCTMCGNRLRTAPSYPRVQSWACWVRWTVSGFDSDGKSVGEPIAVVSMSCRYGGGVHSVDEMWQVMTSGRDTIGEMPDDRGWDLARLHGSNGSHPTSSTRFGSFLSEATDFDAAFFGISPREAVAIEPQQRVLLETSWEAIERAGIDPHTLRGTRTGTYFGVIQAEYGPRMADMTRTKGYQDTGLAASMASGRVAYVLGLRGPSLSIDTACSSSLVAIHTAIKALQSRECSLALAGGGTIFSSASLFVGFSVVGLLSADGATRPFSADATGFGLSEGVGVVLLERLSDAQRLGHPILALVRGSAVVSDGASAGLVVPDQRAQQEAIEFALADAGLDSADIQVVEAHGTATKVGDPIEVAALTRTYGSSHTREEPLWIGSAKSNFGHTQAGSGVTGVIKMVEAIRRGIIPATAHYDGPSPHIDWTAGTVRVVSELIAWPATVHAPRRGAVSANGLSGVNCHLIIEQAPPQLTRTTPPRRELPLVPLVLSARTETALAAQASRLASYLCRRGEHTLTDVGYSLASGRAPFQRRAVLLATDRAEAGTALIELATDREQRPEPVDATAGVVFVFPGQGPQWHGMGSELLDTAPVFAEHVAECDKALSQHLDWSVTDVLRGQPDAPSMDRVDVAQPVLFTIMVALARMWESLGVHPAAVIGHSQGEVAAAYIAGALTLHDAALVIARRSTIMATLTGQGAMVSVPLPADRARELGGDALTVACINSPSSCVLSGPADAIATLLTTCTAEGIDARQVAVAVSSHSPLVEPLQPALEQAMNSITSRSGEVPFVSTVTGNYLDTAELDARYWYHNIRDTVRFEDAVRTAHAQGARVFLEVSAHPVLSLAVHETITAIDTDSGRPAPVAIAATLRRRNGGLRRFLSSAAHLYRCGVAVDWTSCFAGSAARRVDLPTYPFQRQRFWMMPDEGLAPAVTTPRSPSLTSGQPMPQTSHLTDTPAEPKKLDPSTAVQAALAAVLGYSGDEPIEPTSTFADLGLDSLAALSLRHHLESAYGLRFTAADLARHPTPATLAAHLSSELATATAPSTTPPSTEHHRGAVHEWPLSPYQADLIVLGARFPDTPVVQAAQCMRLVGATDVDRLRAAIIASCHRHDALRLRFDTAQVPPVQRLAPAPVGIEFIDLRSETEPAVALHHWTHERANTVLPIDGHQSEFTILCDDTDSLLVFIRFHHAVADGWSLILLAREISAIYFGEDPINAAPSYLSVLDNFRHYRESDQWNTDRDTLVERFQPLTPALFDPSWASTPSPRLGRYSRAIDRPTMERIRTRGPVAALVLAALGVHLHRIHGSGDIVIGLALLNRETPAELATVGDLSNVLPVHIPITAAATFADLTELVRTQVLDLQTRQRFPYGELLRALREITGAASPLFDVRLTYNKIPDHPHAARLRRDVTTLAVGNTLGAVTILLNEYAYDGTIDIEIFYRTEIADETGIDRAVSLILDTLTTAASSTVPLRPRAQQSPTDHDRCLTGTDEAMTIPQLLAATAERYPNHTACSWTTPDDKTAFLTFRELLDRVEALAARLREHNVCPGEFVPVILPRSPELVIAVHAVMTAGAAYVPISPDAPAWRIHTLLADSQARVVIGEPNHAAAYGIEVIAPDRLPLQHTPPATVRPGDLAYMIRTSGSSGIPKGVMIEHRSIMNLMTWMQRHYSLRESDVVLFKAPQTFDASVPELMWLAHGPAVAVLPEHTHTDPRKIINAIERYNVTVVQFVPTMLGPFLDELTERPQTTARIRTLRYILCGGETLHPALVRRFGEIFAAAGLDDVVLSNLWGPTEATYCASYFDITVADARKTSTVPIGTAIDNTELTVTNPYGHPVDTGTPGEITIAGPGLARGYHQRDDLTAEVFITSPTAPGRRRYRTGDLARYNAAGQLEYLGRLDDQIKIRGNRLTLSEVTTHLNDCPGVHAATVIDDTNTHGTTLLVAYYTGTATTGEITAFLRDRLPHYAIPTEIVQLPSIPTTPNGKADRRALSDSRPRQAPQPTPISPSHTQIEAHLTQAWAEVLGTIPNPNDDFFLTGGDSISALQFRAALEKRGMSFELNTLFTNPTITALTQQLHTRNGATNI